MNKQFVAITIGDINGIGIELLIKLFIFIYLSIKGFFFQGILTFFFVGLTNLVEPQH